MPHPARALIAGLVVVGCGVLPNIDVEHRIRVGTDCPDTEIVMKDIVHPLKSGGALVCTSVRVVKGPPHPNATWMECTGPIYRGPR